MSSWVTKALKSPKLKKTSQFVNTEITNAAETAKDTINDAVSKVKKQAPNILNSKKDQILAPISSGLPQASNLTELNPIPSDIQNQVASDITGNIPVVHDLASDGQLLDTAKDLTGVDNIPFLSEPERDIPVLKAGDVVANKEPVYAKIAKNPATPDQLTSPKASPRSSSLTPQAQQPPNVNPENAASLTATDIISNDQPNLTPKKNVTFDDDTTGDFENEETEATTLQTSQNDVTNTTTISISSGAPGHEGFISGKGANLDEAMENMKSIAAIAKSKLEI